jgi:hypothetical protein
MYTIISGKSGAYSNWEHKFSKRMRRCASFYDLDICSSAL